MRANIAIAAWCDEPHLQEWHPTFALKSVFLKQLSQARVPPPYEGSPGAAAPLSPSEGAPSAHDRAVLRDRALKALGR